MQENIKDGENTAENVTRTDADAEKKQEAVRGVHMALAQAGREFTEKAKNPGYWPENIKNEKIAESEKTQELIEAATIIFLTEFFLLARISKSNAVPRLLTFT